MLGTNIFNLKNSKNNKVILKTKTGKVIENSNIQELKVYFHGKNSTVTIYEPYYFYNSEIHIGNNNKIIFNSTKHFYKNFKIKIPLEENNILEIGKDFSCEEMTLHLEGEKNIKITIGDDVMCTYGIYFWASDMHTVYRDGCAINKTKKGIEIGNYVWLGIGVTIL